MSLPAMVWSIEQHIVVDPTARHVLVCLASRAMAGGQAAFPSVETLQRDTCLSERTIRYKLDDLESLGVIRKGDQRIAAKFVRRADRTPTCYDLSIPISWLKAWNEGRGAASAPRDAAGCNGEQNGVQFESSPGAQIAPKPASELIKKLPLRASQDSVQNEIVSDLRSGELDLSQLPETLHVNIRRLVSSTEKPQAYVDLLIARMRRDKSLPIEHQLGNPERWLETIIAEGRPDFSTATAIALEREKRAQQEWQAQRESIRRHDSETKKSSEIAKAQALLSSYSEAELLQLANEAIEELPGAQKNKLQHEVRAEVLNRSLGKTLTRVAILNAISRRSEKEYA